MNLKDLKQMLADLREPDNTPVVLRRGKELRRVKGYSVTGYKKSFTKLIENEDAEDTVIIIEAY